MQVLLTTCGAWYLRQTAKAFHSRNALAGLWISDKNTTALPLNQYRRCWPFHLAMKPFYQFGSQIQIEKAFYRMRGFWTRWIRSQFARNRCAPCDVVQAIMGYATEPFDWAERTGALKVVDCPNSHPTSYFGYWQRECDIWCPGERVPIPCRMFSRMNRELERADLILCPSSFVRETMMQNGIPEEKCIVNPFGVDTSVFQKRANLPPIPRFVCVGTICVRKGHQYLFRAFERVRKQIPEAELVCVGGYKVDFRKERERWEGRFQHFPGLSHPDLARLLQTGTAFVLASVEEGFARVISEAMGAGLPIIATHETGASTLVADGREGILVPARNAEALANAMIRLATDNELSRRLGDASHERGAVRNTWQDYGDRLLEYYRERIVQGRNEKTARLVPTITT